MKCPCKRAMNPMCTCNDPYLKVVIVTEECIFWELHEA